MPKTSDHSGGPHRRRVNSLREAVGVTYVTMREELTVVRLRQSSFLGLDERPGELEWVRHRYSPGEIEVGPKGEPPSVAKDWSDRRNPIWVDGSRLEDGRVGAATVWWIEGGTLPQWTGSISGGRYTLGERQLDRQAIPPRQEQRGL